jgi:alcohol dehydrogenase (NADP+)
MWNSELRSRCYFCRCKTDNEQYCPKQVSLVHRNVVEQNAELNLYNVSQVDTYNAPYPDGVLAQGGYSSAIRVDKQFVFPIPDALESEKVGPLFCAGATVYSPLVRNDVGPGKRVGIVGIGGLGHLAVQFAKALGAHVTVFSHSISKATDAIRLGAGKSQILLVAPTLY